MPAPSFKELLAKTQADQRAQERERAAKAKKEKENILKGSGFTKRLGEQTQRDTEARDSRDYSIEDSQLIKPDFHPDILADTRMDENIQLDQFQQKAVDGLIKQKFGVLIGQAGTGKTTTSKEWLKHVIETLPTIDLNINRAYVDDDCGPDYGPSLLICSFMAKAVQNIKRAIDADLHKHCDTVHGALGYRPDYVSDENGNERRVFRPTFTRYNKLTYKCVLIDEIGTMPVNLWNRLIEALPDDCRILGMGDINQLDPPVGRSPLGFQMAKWPTYALTEIHRQSEGNSIIENADRILKGMWPKPSDNFKMIELSSSGLESYSKTVAVVKKLSQVEKFSPMNDMLIVAQNTGTLGQIHINENLVRFFNPQREENGLVLNPRINIKAGYHQVYFSVGDKIMITANDRPLGLTNGMLGIVEEIRVNQKYKGDHLDEVVDMSHEFDIEDLASSMAEIQEEKKQKDEEEQEENKRQASHIMKIRFQNMDEPIEFSTAGAFKKLVLSYASTCHKSQGGEYPTVVIVCHSANAVLLTREWLYTAVTRAKERVILLYNRRGLNQATQVQRVKGNTIQEKIKHFIKLEMEDNGDTEMPYLPEAEEV